MAASLSSGDRGSHTVRYHPPACFLLGFTWCRTCLNRGLRWQIKVFRRSYRFHVGRKVLHWLIIAGRASLACSPYSGKNVGLFYIFPVCRPDKNARRVRYGCERLCMPPVPEDIFMDAIKNCVLANAKWVPPCGQGSLYIRPLVIGTGPIREFLVLSECLFLQNTLLWSWALTVVAWEQLVLRPLLATASSFTFRRSVATSRETS